MNYKELIKRSGLKQTFIAEKLGISATFLSLVINNKKNMSESKLEALHKLLNV